MKMRSNIKAGLILIGIVNYLVTVTFLVKGQWTDDHIRAGFLGVLCLVTALHVGLIFSHWLIKGVLNEK